MRGWLLMIFRKLLYGLRHIPFGQPCASFIPRAKEEAQKIMFKFIKIIGLALVAVFGGLFVYNMINSPAIKKIEEPLPVAEPLPAAEQQQEEESFTKE